MKWPAHYANGPADDTHAMPPPSTPWVAGVSDDASGTPASTFGRGLLPRSLHVVNPDHSLRKETIYEQNTLIVRQNAQNVSAPKDHRPL